MVTTALRGRFFGYKLTFIKILQGKGVNRMSKETKVRVREEQHVSPVEKVRILVNELSEDLIGTLLEISPRRGDFVRTLKGKTYGQCSEEEQSAILRILFSGLQTPELSEAREKALDQACMGEDEFYGFALLLAKELSRREKSKNK